MSISSFPTLRADSFTTLPIWAQLTTQLTNIWLLTLFSQTAVINSRAARAENVNRRLTRQDLSTTLMTRYLTTRCSQDSPQLAVEKAYLTR